MVWHGSALGQVTGPDSPGLEGATIRKAEFQAQDLGSHPCLGSWSRIIIVVTCSADNFTSHDSDILELRMQPEDNGYLYLK